MAIDLSRIRALCFDVDGTLSDTDDLWVGRFEELLNPLRFAFPKRDVHSFSRSLVMGIETPGNFVYHFLDRLGLDDEVARLVKRFSHQPRRKPGQFWIVPQVKEALVALQKSYPLAIVSARDEESTLAFLNFFGIRSLFSAVATSQTCDYTKPFPHPVQWAAREMGVEPSECLMIGDTVVDIRSGRSAGAQTVGVLCGFGTERELKRCGADLILDNTPDLVDHLIKA